MYLAGDNSVILDLYNKNMGFIYSIAKDVALSYACYHTQENNPKKLTPYSKMMMDDLVGQGKLTFLETINKKEYDISKAKLTTYLYPFIEGDMIRFIESSLGATSIDRNDMTLVRKIQKLYHENPQNEEDAIAQIALELNLPVVSIANHVGYNTHFLSVYDLVGENSDSDPFEILLADKLSIPTEKVVYRKICMELLKELFETLNSKEKTIIGKSLGVFGYPKTKLDDIALEQIMKTDGVIKARKKAIEKLHKNYEGSKLQLWKRAYWTVIKGAERYISL
jgi:DNA-directed RNA polymerase specialized sigma subunit